MVRYSKTVIKNEVFRSLPYRSDNALKAFLMKMMINDLKADDPGIKKAPNLSDVYAALMNDETVDKKAVKLGGVSSSWVFGKGTPGSLTFRLSPSYRLYAEKQGDRLQLLLNEGVRDCEYVRHHTAEDIAAWMVRQKEKLNGYMDEWEEMIKEAAKKVKSDRLAFLAIEAIFVNAMRDYPGLKYEIFEQKRRARIKVRIPNTNLGVCIDGWWGTYKQRLPGQIETLKQVIAFHSNYPIKTFFTFRR